MDNLVSEREAFQTLLGIQPSNQDNPVTAALSTYSSLILSTLQPPPSLHSLLQHHIPEQLSQTTLPRQRFINVDTGMRLRYLCWPGNDDDDGVVILLHDVAQSANSMATIAALLHEVGYTVYAVDLRGHGGSSWSTSSSKLYNAAVMARDIKGFILALDLYKKPNLTLLGVGIGAVVSLTLAHLAPSLITTVLCIEFGLPPAVVKTATSTTKTLDSRDILPWWSFWVGQNAIFESIEECAAFISHPMTNIGPEVLLDLVATAAATTTATTSSLQQKLDALRLSPSDSIAAACSMLKGSRAATLIQGCCISMALPAVYDDDGGYKLAVDPQFCFSFDIKELVQGMEKLKCTNMVCMYGEKSIWVPRQHAQTLVDCFTTSDNNNYAVVDEIPEAGHFLLFDHAKTLIKHIIQHIEASQSITNKATNKNYKTPESLNLRELPVFDSLEQAQKALGPRTIPSTAAIEDELKKLKADDEVDSDTEDATSHTRMTALAHQPSEYFGFIG